MRLPLLTTVSALVLTALLPLSAHAGFEFVPPPKPAPAPVAAAPVPEVTPSAAPVIDAPMMAPVMEAPLLPPADAVSSAPAMPSPVMRAPVATTAPAATATSEPMMIGKKAIPLTPVVKHSDALVMDDAPVASPEPIDAPVSISPRPQAAPRATSNALWDAKKPAADMQVSDLPPPAMKATANISTSDLNDGPNVQGFGRQVPLAMALQQIVPASYRYSFDTGVDPGMRVTWNGGKPWRAVITDLARDNNLNVDIVSNVVAFRRHVPMDIISASANIDTTSDTVLGMPLKPVPAFAANAQAIPTTPSSPILDEPMTTAMNEPMSILPAAEPPMQMAPAITTTETVTTRVEPAREPVASITEKLEVAKAEHAASQQPIFDNAFDDQPASATVKDKKILLADQVPPAPKKKALSPGDAANFDNVQPASAAPIVSAQVKPKPAPESATTTTTVTTTAMPPLPPIDNAPVTAGAAAPMPVANAGMPAASVDMAASSDWEAYKNDTMRQVLTNWSERAGVSLVWSSEYDYPLQTDVRIQGSYNDAVRTLLAGFAKAQPRPLGRLFSNKSAGAKPVLVVETQRLSN